MIKENNIAKYRSLLPITLMEVNDQTYSNEIIFYTGVFLNTSNVGPNPPTKNYTENMEDGNYLFVVLVIIF